MGCRLRFLWSLLRLLLSCLKSTLCISASLVVGMRLSGIRLLFLCLLMRRIVRARLVVRVRRRVPRCRWVLWI
uniref:Uncharacterized protein n=1 Tax=Siphoviridae sp. ct6bU4 TaxID=2825344 RepID=A0A8S5VAH5_9CAUD|nr:MAG TPA: hypothetical protein [Siphoviridae sp. ct6bU4]